MHIDRKFDVVVAETYSQHTPHALLLQSTLLVKKKYHEILYFHYFNEALQK